MATKHVKSRERLCSGILGAVSVPSLIGRPNRAVLGSPVGVAWAPTQRRCGLEDRRLQWPPDRGGAASGAARVC